MACGEGKCLFYDRSEKNNEVDNQAWVERVGARPGVVAGLNVTGQ